MLNSLKLIFLQYEYKCTTICFNDNGLYLHIKQFADRIVGLWQIALSSNICAWLLGGQMSKVHLQTGLMSSTGNGKAVACRSFPFWHSISDWQVGKEWHSIFVNGTGQIAWYTHSAGKSPSYGTLYHGDFRRPRDSLSRKQRFKSITQDCSGYYNNCSRHTKSNMAVV